jgi:hypothetical protein
MNTMIQTKTQAVILEMLLENTGKSLLDSGGAYGRAWEKNQALGAETLVNAPAVIFANGQPQKSVYHFLSEHLEFAEVLDAAWLVWDETHPEESHRENVQTFLDNFGVPENDGFFESGRFELNTYENEYDLLGQILQFTKFGINGTDYLALQIHGGCDVRGGYTKPRIFKVDDFEQFFYASESGGVICNGCGVAYDWSPGWEIQVETSHADGDTEKVENMDSVEIRNHFGNYKTENTCPNCGSAELRG